MESGRVGSIDRTAQQVVGHERTHVDVVSIVISAFTPTVHLIRHTGPLRIIAGSLETARIAARGAASLYIAHTSAETDGIGRDNTIAVLTDVAQFNAVALRASALEIKRTEVDPCAAAHLLINTELRRLPLMPDGVACIIDTFVHRGIADVDGITA